MATEKEKNTDNGDMRSRVNLNHVPNEELRHDLYRSKKLLMIGLTMIASSCVMSYLDFMILMDRYNDNNLDAVFYVFFFATVGLIGLGIKLIPKMFILLIDVFVMSRELKKRG